MNFVAFVESDIFSDESIEALNAVYKENVKRPKIAVPGKKRRMDCVTVLNRAIRALLGDKKQPVGSRINITAKKLEIVNRNLLYN